MYGGHVANFESSFTVELLLYSPKRPVVDFSVVFLWMMAVGTVLCASCWSDFTGDQPTDERYNELSPKVFMFNHLFIIPNLISVLKFNSCLTNLS